MKPIKLTDEQGKAYTLEFNVDTVKRAEDAGLVIKEVDKKPMTNITLLFHYAFVMHHPDITEEETAKILEQLGGVAGLDRKVLEALSSLYAAPFKTVRKNSIKVEL